MVRVLDSQTGSRGSTPIRGQYIYPIFPSTLQSIQLDMGTGSNSVPRKVKATRERSWTPPKAGTRKVEISDILLLYDQTCSWDYLQP